MNKLITWSAVAAVVIVVAGLVYVTFQNDIKKVVPLPPLSQTKTTPLPTSTASATLESLVNTTGSKQGYVLAMPADKIYVRGLVEKWSGQTLTVRIGDKSSAVTITSPVKVLCQPETITDASGNPIQSSQVFIDLTNYKGNPPQVSLDKVGQAFPSGSNIALTAAKQGDAYQVDILVGFGCNL